MIGIGSSVGNYRVVKKLGSGAMGAVYLAEHPQIGKRVALKVIHPDLADNAEMVSRFFNEARAVNQIGHQNIVEVLDFGQTPDGDNFIIMELLEGEGLGDRLKTRPILDVAEMLHIAAQIADGLDASHAHHIIHRDLKPDNIFLLQREGEPDFVKILDFGLAKLTQGNPSNAHKTRAGSVLGTPHYMAPEQCEGKPDVDARVDVYALGCMMYQMVCGHVPFPGDGFAQVLVKHLREPPPRARDVNADVPASVERIILKALAKKKDERFASMKELGQAARDPEAWADAVDAEEAARASPLGATMAGEFPTSPMGSLAAAGGGDGDGESLATLADEMPLGMLEALRSAANLPLPPLGSGTASALSPHAPGSPSAVTTAMPIATDESTGERALPTRRGDGASSLAPGDGRRRDGRLVVIVGSTLVALTLAAAFIVFGITRGGSGKGVGGTVAVVVNSAPPEAEVQRDGKPIGTTPVVLRLLAGAPATSLTIRKDGYREARRQVDGAGQAEIMVTLEAVPAPRPAPAPVPILPPAADPPAPTPATDKTRPPAAPSTEKPPRPAATDHGAPAPANDKPAASRPVPVGEKRAPRPASHPSEKRHDDDVLTPSF